MTKQFCDRCHKDVTGITAAAVTVIGDATPERGGAVTHEWDLCVPCRDALAVWVTTYAITQEAQ